MKKALFVDHAFHKKTRSSDFFIDIVREGYEVEVYYLAPEDDADLGVLAAAADADVVLLWQMDFLAPLFRAMGKPTIVIPMYDGSALMPDLHWHFAAGARFFNFSMRLNERIRMLGGETMLLRYFPAPAAEEDLPRFDRLNAFFWQRRPDHGVHFQYVHGLIGAELDSFHLHNVPDIGGDFRVTVPDDARYNFTESSWFKNRSEYDDCLKASNVFIAPRVAEGIGLALLEAMARGMVVFAHDAPTNNEYISNFINGILFNKDVPPGATQFRSEAHRLGRAAWLTVVEGHRQWQQSHPAILEWINGARPGPPLKIDLEHFYSDLWHSYYGSLAEYEGFLRRQVGVLERLGALPPDRLLVLIGGTVSPRSAEPAAIGEHGLGPGGVLDLAAEGDRYTGAGWSGAEPEWRWAIGTSSELFFSGLDGKSRSIRARFIASALPQLGRGARCTISLNGHQVFKGRITPGWKDYAFSFASELLEPQNRLELMFDKAKTIPGEERNLSVCFKSFKFSPTDTTADSPRRGLAIFGRR